MTADRIPCIALVASLLLAPAEHRAAPRTIRVAAAANLRGALEEVISGFQAKHPGVEVQPSYGASGVFFAQIQQGAPFDLFLSADNRYPAKLADAGLAADAPFTYARGMLVLWVPADSRLDLEGSGVRNLLDRSIQKIAIANPAVAPYGAAAEEVLRSAGVYDALRAKLVLGESVAQVAQFAQSGSAQAAFLPLSMARAPPLVSEGRYFLVPLAAYRPIEQAGVVLRASRDAPLAREFVAWLLGPEGRTILERAGYGPPGL